MNLRTATLSDHDRLFDDRRKLHASTAGMVGMPWH